MLNHNSGSNPANTSRSAGRYSANDDDDYMLLMPTIVIAQNADRPQQDVSSGAAATVCIDSSPDPKVPTALSLLTTEPWGMRGAPPAGGNNNNNGHSGGGNIPSTHQVGRAASAETHEDSATKYASRARGKVPRSPLFCPRKSTAILPSAAALRLNNSSALSATMPTQVIDLTLSDGDDDDDSDVREILRSSKARASSAPREKDHMAQMLFASSVRLEMDQLTQAVSRQQPVALTATSSGSGQDPTVHRPSAATAAMLAASPSTPKLAATRSKSSSSATIRSADSTTKALPSAKVRNAPLQRDDSVVDAPPAQLSTVVSPEKPLGNEPTSAAAGPGLLGQRRERSPTSVSNLAGPEAPKQPAPPPSLPLPKAPPHAVLAAVSGLSKSAALDDEDGFAVPATKRPVDVALRGLFPDKFTFKGFTRDAARVVTSEHVLAPGEFWSAFTTATFLGEGSFGFVWRCVTQDGKTVAVKSSPIGFDCPEAIDDGYSVLREIAVLSFLNKHKVRNVLPMHAAFLCFSGLEALPPTAAQRFNEQETELRLARRGTKAQNDSDSDDDAASVADTVSTVTSADAFEDEPKNSSKSGGAGKRKPAPKKKKAAKKKKPAPKKTQRAKEAPPPPPEAAPSAATSSGTSVKMPTFHAITREQLRGSGATVYMVTQLCDGDLDSIDASTDANIARGVALSVSATLHDMHRLGLVHLDLKPGNILFRRVRVVGQSSTNSFANGAATVLASSASSTSNLSSTGSACISPSQTTFFFGPASHHGRASVSPTENVPPLPSGAKASTSVMVGDGGLLSPGGTAYMTNPSSSHSQLNDTSQSQLVSTVALQFFLSDFGNTQVVGPAYGDDVSCIGTYEYMDYEALAKKRCDRSTDCYSLGMTLYRLLTRKLLHVCKRKHAQSQPHTPSCFAASAKGKAPVLRGRLGNVVTALLNPQKALRMTAAGCYSALTAPAPMQTNGQPGTLEFGTASQSGSPRAKGPTTAATTGAAVSIDASPQREPDDEGAARPAKGKGQKAVRTALNRSGTGVTRSGVTTGAGAVPAAAPPPLEPVRRHGHSPYFVVS